MNQQSYNGWTNYETWLVNLWLTNEEFTERELRTIANNGERRDYRKEELKSFVEDLVGAYDGAGLKTDLINAALYMVNWYEIIDNATEESDDDETNS